MPYRKSKAKKDFDEQASELLNMANSTNLIPLSNLSQSHKELIYQSIIVLLSSTSVY